MTHNCFLVATEKQAFQTVFIYCTAICRVMMLSLVPRERRITHTCSTYRETKICSLQFGLQLCSVFSSSSFKPLLLAGAIHSSPSDVTGPLPSFSSYSNALNKSLLAVILFYYLPLLEREMQRDCSATSLMSHQSKTRKDGMEKKKIKWARG